MVDQNTSSSESIEPGEAVYESNGRLIGRVTGFTNEGFEVEAVGPDEGEQEEIPGQEFGEGYLMWRCTECGEMDEIEDGLPETCSACGAPQEAITKVRVQYQLVS